MVQHTLFLLRGRVLCVCVCCRCFIARRLGGGRCRDRFGFSNFLLAAEFFCCSDRVWRLVSCANPISWFLRTFAFSEKEARRGITAFLFVLLACVAFALDGLVCDWVGKPGSRSR